MRIGHVDASTQKLAEGMIEALETDDRRRPYQITAAGRRHLEAEIGGMKDLVTAGLRRLRRA